MTELETSLVGALAAGVGVWLITTIVHFLVQRHYVRAALESDLVTQKERCEEIRDFLLRYARENLARGEPIEMTAHISKSSFELYDDLRPAIVSKAPSLVHSISRFYSAVGEADQLLKNLFSEVTVIKRGKEPLDEAMYLYLLGKIGRIVGLANLLIDKASLGLEQLPSRYDGRVSPERMLELLNALSEADTLVNTSWLVLTPVKAVLPPSAVPGGELS